MSPRAELKLVIKGPMRRLPLLPYVCDMCVLRVVGP